MIKLGMLEKLDKSKIPNARFVNPHVLQKAIYDSNMDWCAPYFLGVAGVMVNKSKIADYPRSYNIFSDSRFKGRCCMLDDKREVIGDALAVLGKSINSVDDDDLRAAEKIVREKWMPNLAKFDAESYGKSFAAGDFWAVQGYCEVVFGEVPEEDWGNVDFFLPEEGGPAYLDSMCVLKDAKNYDLAMQFINFILDPQNYAEFLDAFRFPATVVPEAKKYTKFPSHYDEHLFEKCELKFDLAENTAKYDAVWERIRY